MCFLHICILLALLFSQQACAQDKEQPVLLMNASVYKGNGEVIKNAALAFQDGYITLLADARLIRLDMRAFEVVEASGLHIYPAVLTSKKVNATSVLDSLYYAPLETEAAGIIAAAKRTEATRLPLLEEGASATFVVTQEALADDEVNLRYLVVKGKLKQENQVSLRLIGAKP